MEAYPAGEQGGDGVVDNALVREFPPRALDKVERLLDLLGELGDHPFLKDKIALHGGTAINLFMLDAPRLSVDIDLSYVGALDRDEMLAERPIVERSIDEVARSQGYPVFGARDGHAGRTFLLGYRSQWGPDHVKIDCIYMNRSPLMPIERRSPILRPELDVPLFTDAELAGGKVKAFFDRVKVRDLYDVANLKRVLDGRSAAERAVAHKAVLFYASLSASFPHGFEDRPGRFAGRGREARAALARCRGMKGTMFIKPPNLPYDQRFQKSLPIEIKVRHQKRETDMVNIVSNIALLPATLSADTVGSVVMTPAWIKAGMDYFMKDDQETPATKP